MPIVSQINQLETQLSPLSDDEIRSRFQQLREKSKATENLSDLIVDCFALVREASKRTIGLRHHDVQIIGGIALHEGNICEMATGEGKTLVATLPITLNALKGDGVHLVTVNSYLAERDASWMGKIYQFLGLSVGIAIPNMSHEEKKKAYASDITYGSNNEFAFDFLRDNMCTTLNEKVQRKLNFALIDEVDQIFIEEARTPLIISGPIGQSSDMYAQIYPLVDTLFSDDKRYRENSRIKHKSIRQLCAHMKSAVAAIQPDTTINLKEKQVELTESGHERIESMLKSHGLLSADQNLYDASNAQILHYIDACLRAKFILEKDIDYIINNNEVVIIDEHTGRAMHGRRWSSGHHQAVEAKEHLKIQEENQTLASITFQNFFRLYHKLSGMTGTADTEAAEFEEIYNLHVIVVPTNKKCIRIEHNDIIYMTQKEKYDAIVEEIKTRNANNQPILVGTTSIENSEYLSSLLNKHKINHRVLNAKQHAQEAEIIAQAGIPGRVTIATNMAGRGTDIVLGGNIENILKNTTNPDEKKQITEEWKKQQSIAKEAGGLHVLGSERHESRRVDNQLRGRCARQGDPGSCQFFLSLEDHLFRIFPQGVLDFIKASSNKPGESLQASMLNSAIASNQQKMEAHYFDIRKQVLKYDNIANDQRLSIYQQRNELLELDDIHDDIEKMTRGALVSIIKKELPDDEIETSNSIITILKKSFRNTPPADLINQITPDKVTEILNDRSDDSIIAKIASYYFNLYNQAVKQAPTDQLYMLEKSVLLQIIDHHWKEHLLTIEDLREGIGFRSYAQKNPEHEFKIEAHALFNDMLDRVKVDYVTQILNIQVSNEQEESQQSPQTTRQSNRPVGKMVTPFD